MIRTKEDLQVYLQADLNRYGGKSPGLKDHILHKEWTIWWKYQKLLRIFEYYENNKNRNILFKLLWLYYLYKHRRESLSLKSFLFPNTLGPGLCIYHVGQVLISKTAKIGKGFTCRPGCVIGNVEGEESAAIIEDNVEFSLGVKVFGSIKIGREALINANSVVMSNIPPYAIVVGNPGKIIGFRMSPKKILEYEQNVYPEDERISLEVLQQNYEKYFLNRRKEIINFLKV